MCCSSQGDCNSPNAGRRAQKAVHGKKWLSQIFCKNKVRFEEKDPELNQATYYVRGWSLVEGRSQTSAFI